MKPVKIQRTGVGVSERGHKLHAVSTAAARAQQLAVPL
jgi:hypothetical protein